uniref:Protein TSSC4 n=1 Tax=Anthurium amnicola TaxID=1678845 RepID=A0A1D1Y619_9ARAE
MEESEKRKERLRAMRAATAQSEAVEGHIDSLSPIHLLNPLHQPSATPPGAERSPPAPRFDYYTNPMSAYSGDKRSSGLGHHPPDNFSSPIRGSLPVAHLPSPSSAGQGRQHMNSTPVSAHLQFSYSPHQGSYATPLRVPQYRPWRSPVGMAGAFPGNSSVSMPGIQDGCGSNSGYGLPHNASRSNVASPNFARGLSPHANSGRGSSSASLGRGSPSANSGRGGSWRSGNYHSPSSGRGGRGGRGSKELLSALEWPHLFFSKVMVKDPWVELAPVVGCILEPPARYWTPDSMKSWLPESIRTKKAKVKETVSVSNSGRSLAEDIALALEEAVNDETV